MTPITSKHALYRVTLFFVCFFLFLNSGRISSGDAGTQLQAAMLLATTGQLGTKSPSDQLGEHGLWVRNSAGIYYQCHDIGNIALMFPAAWLASHLSHAPAQEKIKNPPILARLGVALTYAGFSAIGCIFLFRLFAIFYPIRTAFLLSLTFALATYFCVYTKSAWDVLGASIGVCVLLFYSAKIILSTQHSALNTQHSALSTQHSALSTQHSALSTQHSALSTQVKVYHFGMFVSRLLVLLSHALFDTL